MNDDDVANLEFSVEQMRAMLGALSWRLVDHVATAGEQPSCGDLAAEDLCRSMREPAPREGTDLEALLEPLFTEWLPRSYTTIGPGYLGYIPGGGVFPAALADLFSNMTNRFTGIWEAAPALVQLEANVLDWLRDWMGFPETAAGVFTTGGSTANLNAIVCAREKLLGDRLRDGVLYASDQVHHSVTKSARVAGVLPDRVRMVASDKDFRMRPDDLERQVLDDRAAGLIPFVVVSSAGTTNTGAVDPLDDIADLCAREGLWHHVDGAYGAFFHACPQLRPLLSGLDRADSLTLDPHKGMFLPYGTGALLVRRGADLRAVHATTAAYLPNLQEEFYDPSHHGPDLSRGFPGLRVWMAMKMFGTARYEAAIAEKRELALETAQRFAEIPGIVIDAPPQLSLFAFHLHADGWTSEQDDAATRLLLDRVRNRGRVMLTGCTAHGRFLGRLCVLSFRTRHQHVLMAVEDVAAEARALLSEGRQAANSP